MHFIPPPSPLSFDGLEGLWAKEIESCQVLVALKLQCSRAAPYIAQNYTLIVFTYSSSVKMTVLKAKKGQIRSTGINQRTDEGG